MTNTGGIIGAQLRTIVERIERLEEEKAALADDIREVYAEAKANGYDTRTLRQVVKLRKQDRAEREEREALLETYLHALGMLADTPLGQAAIARGVEESEGADIYDDPRVTISAGDVEIETTAGAIREAADRLERRPRYPLNPARQAEADRRAAAKRKNAAGAAGGTDAAAAPAAG